MDVAGSSLASFALGVFATRFLGAEALGVYALCFTGFLLGAVVPAQLLCVPAELDALRRPEHEQFEALRSLAPAVLLVGAGTAFITVALIAATVGTARSGFWPLSLTMVPTAALSPLQDHIRRLCHQADRSELASTMSTLQAATTILGLLVLSAAGVRTLAPFGALGLANVVSTAVGVQRLRRDRTRLADRTLATRALIHTGRWLTGAGAAQAAGGLCSLLLVARLAGVTAAGICEAVRVLSQPVYVVATGLMAVLNPVVFRARLAGDRREEQRAHLHFVVTLGVSSLAVLLVASRLNPWNPLERWFPAAYREAWLLEAVIVAQALFHLPLSIVSSMLADRRVPRASVGQMAGFPPQLALASTASAVGAWAFALALLGAAVSRIVAIGSLRRVGDGGGRVGGDGIRRALRGAGKGPHMAKAHPIEEPSIVGAVLRHPLIVGLCLVGGLLLGGVGAVVAADTYDASTELTVQDPRLTALFQGSPNLDAKRYVADQVALTQSPEVLRQAASRLTGARWGEVTLKEVRTGLTVRSSDASNTFIVAFRAGDEAFATAANEAVVIAYIDAAETVTRSEFDNTENALQNQLDELDQKIATLDQEIASYQDAGATLVDARLDAATATRSRLYDERTQLSVRHREVEIDLARNPSGVTRRSTTFTESAAGGALRFVLLGAFLGGLVGTTGVYAAARRRRTFESPEEPEQLLGLRYLVTIPAHGRSTPPASVQRQRESVLEFLATVVEGEARRRRICRFGFVSPSSSVELGPLGVSMQNMLGGMESPTAGATVDVELSDAVPAHADRPLTTIDLREEEELPTTVGQAADHNGVLRRHGSNGHSGYGAEPPFRSVFGVGQAGATITAVRRTAGGGDGDGDLPADVGDLDADVHEPGAEQNESREEGAFNGEMMALLVDDEVAVDAALEAEAAVVGAGDDPGDIGASIDAPSWDTNVDDAPLASRVPSSFGNGSGSMTQRTEPDQSTVVDPSSDRETLVLVECPGYADADRNGDQIDAIVVVVDHGESIAATAEVARRVQVLGWELLGYIYVSGRGAN